MGNDKGTDSLWHARETQAFLHVEIDDNESLLSVDGIRV